MSARTTHARRWTWRNHLPALLLLAAILGSLVFASVGWADNTIPDPGYVVSATTPTTGITDGQPVTINVLSRSTTFVFRIEIHECVADATYTSEADIQPAQGKCASKGVSTSGDGVVVRGDNHVSDAVQTATGANLDFRVGVGSAKADPTDAASATIVCDSTHPCVLLVQLDLANDAKVFQKIALGLSDTTPLSACGGPAPGIVSSGGSDQLQDAWAKWTRSACQAAGATGAPTGVVFSGEGVAVQKFSIGQLDLAYTAAGYDNAVGFGPADASKRRAAVAVPIALDAAVVAAGGGETRAAPFYDKPKYSEVKLSAGQAGALFGGALAAGDVDNKYAQGIIANNPDFGSHIFQTAPGVAPQVAAEAESSSWFLTNYFTARAPDAWTDPETKTARAASAAFATASPPFPLLATYSGRTTLQKVTDLAAQNFTANGPIWVATDLATANALNLTPVSIENANGEFVAPTPGSMAAAVPTMKADANGLLIPDPNAVGTSAPAADATVQPYPLTYIVYALVPAETLIDPTTCAAATTSQTLLHNWLTYLTGEGQTNLPAGLEPLTPELATTAAAAIPKVGASKFSGTCVPQTPTTPTTAAAGTGTTNPTAVTAQNLGVSPTKLATPVANVSRSSSRASIGSTIPTVPAVGSLTPLASSTPGATKPNETHLAAIPAFAGHHLADTTDGMLALIGIVIVTSLAAWVTAGPGAGGAALAGADGAGAAAPSVAIPTEGPKVGSLIPLWIAVAVASFGLVVYQLGPVLQQRDQRSLLSQYRVAVRHAAAESGTVTGVQVATKPPEAGSAVGILEIGALETQKVVVEGVSPSDTEKGSGHVPGTAGLGQPGNSVLVARRNAFGGSFGDLSSLRLGQKILVTTTQGQSVYSVCAVETRNIHQAGGSATSASAGPATATSSAAAGAGIGCAKSTTTKTTTKTATTAAGTGSATTATGAGATTTAVVPTTTTRASAAGTKSALKAGGPITTDALYGPSRDDRLTLVTSASRMPWNSNGATVVVAKMIGKPFAPTPQGARSDQATGRNGDSSVWATVVLVLVLYAGAIVASVLLYRRMRFRVAYILTIAPLVALTVIAGGTISRLLPAWT